MTSLKPFIIVIVSAFLLSCGAALSPTEVNSTLPTLTKSTILSQAQADEAVQSNACNYLVKDRTYVAEVMMSPKGDLKNAAKGIDEWVKLDGGNTYVLKNYYWEVTDHNGTTQLTVEFDTLLCQ